MQCQEPIAILRQTTCGTSRTAVTNKEFLLKFARDHRRWRYWLFEARKRYNLFILNYIVTSNHIHLLVRGMFRESIATESGQLLKEAAAAYDAAFTGKMACLRGDNRVTVRWTV